MYFHVLVVYAMHNNFVYLPLFQLENSDLNLIVTSTENSVGKLCRVIQYVTQGFLSSEILVCVHSTHLVPQ